MKRIELAAFNPTFYADLENPQSLNKYQYTYNNPYKFNDPYGHCPDCPTAPAIAWIPIAAGIAYYIHSLASTTGPREQKTTAQASFEALELIPGGKAGGLLGGALLKGVKSLAGPAAKVTRAVTTEVKARSLVQTVKKEAAKGGNRPGKSAKPIRATERTINRAGKIWTNNGRPLKGQGGKPAPRGLANRKTGRSYRAPVTKKYSPRKVANFQSKNPKANVHVEVK